MCRIRGKRRTWYFVLFIMDYAIRYHIIYPLLYYHSHGSLDTYYPPIRNLSCPKTVQSDNHTYRIISSNWVSFNRDSYQLAKSIRPWCGLVVNKKGIGRLRWLLFTRLTRVNAIPLFPLCPLLGFIRRLSSWCGDKNPVRRYPIWRDNTVLIIGSEQSDDISTRPSNLSVPRLAWSSNIISKRREIGRVDHKLLTTKPFRAQGINHNRSASNEDKF